MALIGIIHRSKNQVWEGIYGLQFLLNTSASKGNAVKFVKWLMTVLFNFLLSNSNYSSYTLNTQYQSKIPSKDSVVTRSKQ
jgi:hypothetical protein